RARGRHRQARRAGRPRRRGRPPPRRRRLGEVGGDHPQRDPHRHRRARAALLESGHRVNRRNGLRGLAIAGSIAGGVAAGAAIAVGVPRYLARRTRASSDDPYADEPFELPPTNSVRTVISHDGVPIHVETVGAEDAALTVVFAHGYLQDSSTFYFQRKAIAEAASAGSSLRAVFYDQPGRSEEHTSELQSRENLVCRLLLEK